MGVALNAYMHDQAIIRPTQKSSLPAPVIKLQGARLFRAQFFCTLLLFLQSLLAELSHLVKLLYLAMVISQILLGFADFERQRLSLCAKLLAHPIKLQLIP